MHHLIQTRDELLLSFADDRAPRIVALDMSSGGCQSRSIQRDCENSGTSELVTLFDDERY